MPEEQRFFEVPRFKEQGVKTLYLEHVLSDVHQSDLNALFSKAGKITKHRLKSYLNQLDNIHGTDMSPFHNYFSLVKLASKKGIRVIAIDSTTSYEWVYRHITPTSERIKMLNWYAQDIINTYQAEAGQGQKWVALVGSMHVNTYENIPGLAELTGATGVLIHDGKPVKKTIFRQGADTVQEVEIGGTVVLLKPDFVHEVPDVPKFVSPYKSEFGDYRIDTTDPERIYMQHHSRAGEIISTPIKFDTGYYVEIPRWLGVHRKRFRTLKLLAEALEKQGLSPNPYV